MRFIALILILTYSISAAEVVSEAPAWVPAAYKQDFINMVNSCNVLSEQGEAMSKALKSPLEVYGCAKEGKGVLIKARRASIDASMVMEFNQSVVSCEYSNGRMELVFDGAERPTFMGVLKYTAIIVGSIAVGFLAGKASSR